MPTAERTTFEDLAKLIKDDYAARGNKTTRYMLGRVKRLREVFGKVRPADVTYQDLQNYITKRDGAGAKPATIRNEVTSFGRMILIQSPQGNPEQESSTSP